MKYIHNKPPEPEWEPWFAWHSVSVGKDGKYGGRYPSNGDIVVHWEWVERKFISWQYTTEYAYRLPQNSL